ncbi:MAG: hypothetical protein ACXAB7_12275 [Candidatus Kariarchaeaceae archaeon]|jgi:transposase
MGVDRNEFVLTGQCPTWFDPSDLMSFDEEDEYLAKKQSFMADDPEPEEFVKGHRFQFEDSDELRQLGKEPITPEVEQKRRDAQELPIDEKQLMVGSLDERINLRVQQGASLKDIAEAFGEIKKVIGEWMGGKDEEEIKDVDRLPQDLSPLDIPKSEHAKQELFDKYPKSHDLAKVVGTSSKAVVEIFRPQFLRRAIEYRSEGKQYNQIGPELGVDRKTVSKWLREDDVDSLLADLEKGEADPDVIESFVEGKFIERCNTTYQYDAQDFQHFVKNLPELELEKQIVFEKFENLQTIVKESGRTPAEIQYTFEPQLLRKTVELVHSGMSVGNIAEQLGLPSEKIQTWIKEYSIPEHFQDKILIADSVTMFIASIFIDQFEGERILDRLMQKTTLTEYEQTQIALEQRDPIKIPLSGPAKQLIFNAYPRTDKLMKVTGLGKTTIMDAFRLQFLGKAVELKFSGEPYENIAKELGFGEITIKNWFERRRINFDDFRGKNMNTIMEFVYPQKYFFEKLMNEILNQKSIPQLGTVDRANVSSSFPSIQGILQEIFNESPNVNSLVEKTGKPKSIVGQIFEPQILHRIVELKVFGLSNSMTAKALGYKGEQAVGLFIKKYDLNKEFNNFNPVTFTYQKLNKFIESRIPFDEHSKFVIKSLPKTQPRRPNPVSKIQFKSIANTLHSLDKGKINVKDIAKKTGCSENEVKYIYKPYLLRKSIELRQDDLSFNKIGIQVGFHGVSVSSWMKDPDVIDFVKQNDFSEESWNQFLSEKYPVQFTPERIVLEYLDGKTIPKLIEDYRNASYIPKLLREYLNFIPLSSKLKDYVKSGYTISISPYLKEVLTGELLGDSYLEPKNRGLSKDVPYVDVKEYKTALNMMRKIPKIENLEDKIGTYNKFAETIYNARTARFKLGKSTEKEEKWGKRVQKILQKEGYNIT